MIIINGIALSPRPGRPTEGDRPGLPRLTIAGKARRFLVRSQKLEAQYAAVSYSRRADARSLTTSSHVVSNKTSNMVRASARGERQDEQYSLNRRYQVKISQVRLRVVLLWACRRSARSLDNSGSECRACESGELSASRFGRPGAWVRHRRHPFQPISGHDN